MDVEKIAEFCHEINRIYCAFIGDNSQLPWKVAPDWQKQSAIASVVLIQQDPKLTASAVHAAWMKRKLEEGWTYGPVKDSETKTHPCLLPYEELPLEQQVKDQLFRNAVYALTLGDKHE